MERQFENITITSPITLHNQNLRLGLSVRRTMKFTQVLKSFKVVSTYLSVVRVQHN